MSAFIKIIRAAAALAVVIYLACLTGLYVDQRHLIFHPYPSYAAPTAQNAGAGMREFPVATDDGLALKGWYHPAAPGRLTIVFFHGNADGLQSIAFVALPYVAQGYGFLIPEYRGYSTMPGIPNEDGFYRDGRAYLRALQAQGIAAGRIVVFGHSLGSGVATQMATEFSLRGLALIAPFLSVGSVAQLRYPMFPADLLTTERFDNFRKIGLVHCPILIGHGLKDTVVPEPQGQALFDLALAPKTLRLFPDDGHSNAFADFASVALPWLTRLDK